MNTITYYGDKFHVVKVKDFDEPLGKFRMIRYDTGYYGLQKYTLYDVDDEEGVWETLCISPHMDDPLAPDRVWYLCQGKLIIDSIFNLLEDSRKLHNNELMELHLNLNPELDDSVQDEIIKKISTSDGEDISEAIIDSICLQDEYVQEYYSNQRKLNKLHMLLAICFIFICVLFIASLLGV